MNLHMGINGSNGGGSSSLEEIGELPRPGLWLIVVDGGVLYLVRTAEDLVESEVAGAWAENGKVQFQVRTIIVLDSVRAAVAGADRKPEPFALAISQRIDQRAGLCEDFPVLMTANSIALLSSMSPMLRAQLRLIYDNNEATLLAKRAERAGIALPTR